jgi:hypothetical protein
MDAKGPWGSGAAFRLYARRLSERLAHGKH